MGPELVLGFVGLLALVAKVTDFFRLVANFATQKSAVLTQSLAFAGGIVAVELFAHTDFADTVTVGGRMLGTLNGWTLVLIGLMVSSAASLVIDYKQAKDQTDSAVKPPLTKG